LLTLIYPYRNRELERLKNSLDSLKNQTDSEFEVYFVDYGSEEKKAKRVELICGEFDFVTYKFYSTQFQPWNKSKSLNSVIKNLETDFCFVADVDMIFHPQFIEKALKLQASNKTVYFQVGFLGPEKGPGSKEFEDYENYRKSTFEATGLSMFPVRILKELRGFDEFYHFWGAEDSDMHVRIKNAGYEVEFYDEEVLMLHQWHPSYRSSESSDLSKELQISGIVQLNHQHVKYAVQYKTTKVNRKNWGECISLEEFNELEKAPVNFVLDNEQRKIDHLMFVLMPRCKDEILKITIRKDPFQNSPKSSVKKLMGKKVPEYYSLKEINDKILLHLISFYRNKAYTYKITEDLKSIEMAVKL
jgi:glycosyltransferase involved in cell wall biosynthesis